MKYKITLQHVEHPIFGRFWTFEFKDMETGKTIVKDSTAEDCTEEQARECAYRSFYNRTGIKVHS